MFFRQSDKCSLSEGQPYTNFKGHVTNEETNWVCDMQLYYIIFYYVVEFDG